MRKKVVEALAISVLLLSLCFVLGAETANAETNKQPKHIHLSWANDDTASSIAVTWRTDEKVTNSRIYYDESSQEGVIEDYKYSKKASDIVATNGEYIHEVALTSLTPGEKYHFICGSEEGGYSSEYSFNLPSQDMENLRFVMGGDSRSRPSEREDINRAMAKTNPLFAVHTGDFVSQGADQSLWDEWFNAMQSQWITPDGSLIPIVPARGNHELVGYENEGISPHYFEQFTLPNNEKWYSLNFGDNLLHIVTLDLLSEDSAGPEEQVEWLKQDLKEHSSYKWTIVSFHAPPFASGEYHESNKSAKETYSPIFDNYNVDIVVNGHSHIYARIGPLSKVGSEWKLDIGDEDGTVYYISGGWGAPMYPISPRWWTVNAFTERTHFISAEIVKENFLLLKTMDENRKVLDAYFRLEGKMPKIKENILTEIINTQDYSLHQSMLRESVLTENVATLQKKLEDKEWQIFSQKTELNDLKNEKSQLEDSKSQLKSQLTIGLVIGVIAAFIVGFFLSRKL